jgi:pilus assembly protein Flp/PilA
VEESARQQQECVVRRLLRTFAADESGATSIEYALIAVAISISIIGGLQLLRSAVIAKYNAVSAAVS